MILGQLATGSTLMEVLFVADDPTIVSTLFVNNVTGSTSTFSIAVLPSKDTAVASRHYIYDIASIRSAETIAMTLGLALEKGDQIQVKSGVVGVRFSAFGVRH